MFPEAVSDLTRTYTPAEMLTHAIALPPGDRGTFSYSNTNYLLLGRLVEAVDGGDLGESLERRITTPLGLVDTWFDTNDRPAPTDLAAGWFPGVFDGDPDTPYTAISSGAWAAGALISTVEDLETFLDAPVGGKLLSNDMFDAMTDTGDNAYGFGIGEAGLGAAGAGWYHSGVITGYQATMGITSDGDASIVIATNADRLDAGDFAGQILVQL